MADGLQEPVARAALREFLSNSSLFGRGSRQNGPVSPLAAAGSSGRLAGSLAHRTDFPGSRRPRALAFGAQDRVEALQLGRVRGTGPGQVAIIDLMLFHTGTNGQGARRFTAAGFR